MPPVLRSIARADAERQVAEDREKSSRFELILRDIQFWVPVAALVAGLVVLNWIS